MTTSTERTRAVIETQRFLVQLGAGRHRVPKEVREMAQWLLRHYPSASSLFMAAHGYAVFADPGGAAVALDVPPPGPPEEQTVVTPEQYQTLIDIVACTPVPGAVDRREWLEGWLEQWLDMPHPALGGRSPRTVAHRPGGYDIVRHVLMAVLDSAYL